ncbi:PoNe immunity protein domain-containing protein [Pseudomonas sp. DE0010]|uniref:PoNe immunity protein domain-containing protein n=1 Tax=Pseudomonas sp. DE0010 TaxID=2584951 RepID=UPI00211455BC|nr:PoNe immunity protein domain-containing protein [Pseudomonas sp. DE0010]
MKESNLPLQQWMITKILAKDFDKRREPHLRYVSYTERFDELIDGIKFVCELIDKNAKIKRIDQSASQRLWDTLNWLSLQYSSGCSVSLFRESWPHILSWTEQYAETHEAHHLSNNADIITPHISINDDEYWIVALRLICFGLLTGNAEHMPKIMAIIDYANTELGIQDGLLERLVAPFVPGRGTLPDTATRHLPYRKLFKVFDAAPDKRPALMAKYLDEWYHASRREPYIDQHGEADFSFYGYWSWEAAAVTWLLQIDDSSYRDIPFYPRDLADFAHNLPATPATPSAPPPTYAGQPCPRAGYWFTLAQHGSRRHFAQDDLFPEIPSETSKGLTLWQWADDQGDEGTSGQ